MERPFIYYEIRLSSTLKTCTTAGNSLKTCLKDHSGSFNLDSIAVWWCPNAQSGTREFTMPSEFSLRTVLYYRCNCVLSLERMDWATLSHVWFHTFDTQSTYSNDLVEARFEMHRQVCLQSLCQLLCKEVLVRCLSESHQLIISQWKSIIQDSSIKVSRSGVQSLCQQPNDSLSVYRGPMKDTNIYFM